MSVFAPLKNIAKIINFRGLQAFFLKIFKMVNPVYNHNTISLSITHNFKACCSS